MKKNCSSFFCFCDVVAVSCHSTFFFVLFFFSSFFVFVSFCLFPFSLCSDGHGGEEASHYTHLNLAQLVTSELDKQYRAKMGLPAASAGADEQKDATAQYSIEPGALSALCLDYKHALGVAFDKLEENVLRQSRHIGCRDGTTVTSVLVTHDTIYCGNVGDSRTVLCRENNAVALSHDHKPSGAEERSRIVAAGGEVRAVMLDRAAFCCFQAKKVPHGAERLWPGGFSVSRAVGDIDYKDLRRKKANVINVLIHRPDITVTSVSPRDQFVICGSDGLWDVLTNQQAVDFVLKELKRRKSSESVADIAQKLADHAYSLGSEDNITALIVFFVNNDELPLKP
jgi:serine/threonine protein phosphatase PrpC